MDISTLVGKEFEYKGNTIVIVDVDAIDDFSVLLEGNDGREYVATILGDDIDWFSIELWRH